MLSAEPKTKAENTYSEILIILESQKPNLIINYYCFIIHCFVSYPLADNQLICGLHSLVLRRPRLLAALSLLSRRDHK